MQSTESTIQNARSEFPAKKAQNLIRDSRLSGAVLLIPLLSLVFLFRLAQWYRLRNQYPVLASINSGGEYAELAKQFGKAKSSLWFAVLLWPGLILFCLIYLRLS
jgi:hypothetical protein